MERNGNEHSKTLTLIVFWRLASLKTLNVALSFTHGDIFLIFVP